MYTVLGTVQQQYVTRAGNSLGTVHIIVCSLKKLHAWGWSDLIWSKYGCTYVYVWFKLLFVFLWTAYAISCMHARLLYTCTYTYNNAIYDRMPGGLALLDWPPMQFLLLAFDQLLPSSTSIHLHAYINKCSTVPDTCIWMIFSCLFGKVYSNV